MEPANTKRNDNNVILKKGPSLINMISQPDWDYLHVQTPDWFLSIIFEIRAIQSTLTNVLDQNKILDQKVNSFSETELLLQQTRQELVSAQQEIKHLTEQLATAKSVAPTHQ
ncbi:hypothetical protein INT48_008636 [Thamnidium elegans]|uniref:Uncharacterized protein n=1 Tax=Thamnidium elegans TaxID=101142 RepID=A0A8H7SG12_9FUNG|nr:hypothetical protein INT48_008636 [Thamnidium elegans]